jgi:hypothetical protein
MNEYENKINRRDFLKKTSAVAASMSLASAATDIFGGPDVYGADMDDDLDRYDFIFARVKFIDGKNVQDHWDVRPGGDANLLEELRSVIRCKIKPIHRTNNWSPQRARPGQLNAVVTWDEPERLKKFPFLFMTGENYYKLSRKQRLNLKEYIKQGGFLHMDDCMVDPAGDFFYQDSFRILNEIFGVGAVRDIPNEHEIFHNVYDLGAIGLPWVQAQNHGAKGVFVGDRLAIFLSSTDLHCGWCDRAGKTFGRGRRRKLGIHGYKEAIQMGINIIMYAMTH